MLIIDVPGHKELRLIHLVLDFNGTIALDGEICAGVTQLLVVLAKKLKIHVITADTHGSAASQLAGLPITLQIIGSQDQDLEKFNYINKLGMNGVVAIGNGRNDLEMLRHAALGVCILAEEGCCGAAMLAADLVCRSITEGLQLLLNSNRIRAGLRN